MCPFSQLTGLPAANTHNHMIVYKIWQRARVQLQLIILSLSNM